MGQSEHKTVSTRITRRLDKVIGEYLQMDAHVTMADFVRDAIREKLKRDTPELYRSMFTMEAPQGEPPPYPWTSARSRARSRWT